MSRRNKGFSLIELMIVTAVILVLGSVTLPAFQRYMRKAKNTEAITAIGALNKAQIITFSENNHFGHCVTNMTAADEAKWETGDKFPLDITCTDNIQFAIPQGAFTHFQYTSIPGKYAAANTLDPAVDAAAVAVGHPVAPVNFETSEIIFNTMGAGAGACEGGGAGVTAMTGVGLGLEAVPPAGYGYYVAFGIANLNSGGASPLALSEEACSLIFQIVEYNPAQDEGFSVSPIVVYAFGE